MYTGAKCATYLTTTEHGFAEREDTEFNKYFIFPYYIFEKTMVFFPWLNFYLHAWSLQIKAEWGPLFLK